MWGQPQEALAAHKEARAAFENLLQTNSGNNRWKSGLTWNNIGLLRIQQKQPADAVKFLQQARDVLSKFNAAQPSDEQGQRYLAATLENLASTMIQRSPTEALKFHQQAIELQNTLAEAYPSRLDFQQQLAVSYDSYGLLLTSKNGQRKAEIAFRSASSAATTALAYSLLSQSSDEGSIQTSAETAVDRYWQPDFDGFIEFPRPISAADIRSGNSLQEHPEALEESSRNERHSTELDQSEGLELNIDSSDGGASIAVAIEFFNQQTAGGFVDSGLDALNDNTQFAVIPAGGYRNGLEASIRRVNPFDDGRYAAMLTTVQSQTEGDSPTSHVGENAAMPNMAMVGLVFGVASVRSRAFGQFVETFRRLTKRLGMLLTGRTKW